MKKPVISVVIATYKRPEILSRAVDSVLMQDFRDFEIIVVDDNGAGSDMQLATRKMLEKRYKDKRIVYVANRKGLGGGGARNEGIVRARGEFVAFLDDDEDWLPGKLTRQIQKFSECPDDTGVVDTGFYSVFENGTRTYHSPEMSGWIFEDLLAKSDKRAPKLSTMLCRKTALEKAGMFDPEFRSRQDLDLYARLAKVCRFESIDEPFANKRHDADERISTNVDSKIQGYRLFYEKNYDDLVKRPDLHADYLIRYALVYIRGRKYMHACGKVLKAFYIVRFNPVKVFRYSRKVIIKFLQTLKAVS